MKNDIKIIGLKTKNNFSRKINFGEMLSKVIRKL